MNLTLYDLVEQSEDGDLRIAFYNTLIAFIEGCEYHAAINYLNTMINDNDNCHVVAALVQAFGHTIDFKPLSKEEFEKLEKEHPKEYKLYQRGILCHKDLAQIIR